MLGMALRRWMSLLQRGYWRGTHLDRMAKRLEQSRAKENFLRSFHGNVIFKHDKMSSRSINLATPSSRTNASMQE
jgi:hypothetical protein